MSFLSTFLTQQAITSSLSSWFGSVEAGKWYAASDGWKYSIIPGGKGILHYQSPTGKTGAQSPYSTGWNSIVKLMGWDPSAVVSAGGGTASASTPAPSASPQPSYTPVPSGQAPPAADSGDKPFWESGWFLPSVAVGAVGVASLIVFWPRKRKGKK